MTHLNSGNHQNGLAMSEIVIKVRGFCRITHLSLN